MTRLTVPAAAAFAVAGFAAPWLVPPHGDLLWTVVWQLVAGAGFAAAGCAVTAEDRRSRPGWLLWLAGLLLLAAPVAVAAGRSALSQALWVLVVLAVVPLALLRVVTPRPAPRLLATADVLLLAAGLACVAGAATGSARLAGSAATAGAVVVLCAGWLLFELTSGEDRRRVLWVVLGCAVTVPTGALLLVAIDEQGPTTVLFAVCVALLTLALPATATIALLRPRLVDVRDVIHRVTVLVVMFALVGAVYVGTETAVQAATGELPPRGVRVLAVFAVAAAFHPLMLWIRASMDEMLFGGRADPVDTLTQLGTHLASGSTPPQWLDTLRVALAVPGVELRTATGVLARSGAAPTGEDGPPAAVTELWADGQHVGDLVVALPAEQLHLPPRTAAVLSLVAAPLAQTLHAARLTEQLVASRGRVVAALEEERRRMRRDLHDGLGPTLTGIAYSADASANLLRADPDEATRILRLLRADAADAIAEVRRIVYGLRPRALDELGLVGAVRQQLSHLRAADGAALAVTITAPAGLPELPAAVEVAAYRVAVEAVTNVARHAGVAAATVDLALPGEGLLRVVVRDAGRSTGPWRPGVGLRSMHERVEQIGGSLTVHTGPDGSTVTADIPLDLPGG